LVMGERASSFCSYEPDGRGSLGIFQRRCRGQKKPMKYSEAAAIFCGVGGPQG